MQLKNCKYQNSLNVAKSRNDICKAISKHLNHVPNFCASQKIHDILFFITIIMDVYLNIFEDSALFFGRLFKNGQ